MDVIRFDDFMALLGNFVSVENAPSRNGYNTAPNQFIITFENGKVLQSYKSFVAAKVNGRKYVTHKHDYSATTSRFVKEFLGMNKAERLKALDCEEITMVDQYEE